MRAKYVAMKHFTPSDFGVDPYFLLNPQSPIAEELSKKISH